ncbi:MAG: undecaprenyl/decaprenyl-phosphate alpha-N-acetylglucosaminyl 1-phosphate transferase [Anaerolineales bacterium]|nr:undecaprenyl/decaprenyl-phosphate alpha-N-acetylglucosaminyl 1-phosphate transferase [Anaerolineales bacterium]
MDLYLPLVIFSFLAAFIATPLIGRVATHTGFVDEPKPHKMHVRPMPLLGGLAIYLALCVALFRVDFSTEWLPMLAVAVGATMLMLIGLWDDRRGIAPRAKLLAQVGAALLVTAAGVRVELTPWPAVNILISVFWFVGITNAINLMDNMDGLAAGTSAVSALFFTILAASAGQGLVASLAAAVTGASLGFLYYNISPAMIFMGDTGSLLLGFLLAVIGVRYAPSELPLGSTWMVPIVVMGLPIFDTTLVTFSRILNRRPVSQGGTDHTSHRLSKLGLGNHRAVFSMYLAAGILGILAVFMTHSSPELATVIFGVILAVGLIALIILERMPPIPPNNPQVVILAEDEQGMDAIAAARRLSSNIVAAASPRTEQATLRNYLRALALEPEAFDRWLNAGAGAVLGPAAEWQKIFRLAGRILPCPEDPGMEQLHALLRTADLIVACRGGGWPAEIQAAAARGRMLAAPGATISGVVATADDVWKNSIGLTRAMEEAILGARRKEKSK